MKFFKLHHIAGVVLFALFIGGCNRANPNLFQGYIEGRFTYVSSQMTGTLENLAVERGSQLKIGQNLAILESSPEFEEYKQAQAHLKKAESNLADLQKGKRPSEIAAIEDQQKQVIAQIVYSEKTVERYQHLVKTQALQQAKLDEAISNYNNLNAQLAEITENLKTAKLPSRIDQVQEAKDQVSAAQAALEQAKWQLKQKQLPSPINGRVYDTFYRIGETVPATMPILSALDPKNVYVVFFIPEQQLASISVGRKISFSCDSCKHYTPATIYFIANVAEYTPPVIYSEHSRKKLSYRVEAKLSINDAKQFNPGQPITVSIANTRQTNAKR